MEFAEAEHARLLADAHGDAIRALGSTEERIAYLAGVLDAWYLDAKGDIG